MASIVKRKKKYSVVYTYTDENGNKRQKWETFETNAEAKKRKLQVEYEQESGTFIPPSAKTVNDLLDEYMSMLAELRNTKQQSRHCLKDWDLSICLTIAMN